jgi:hypothetical protein
MYSGIHCHVFGILLSSISAVVARLSGGYLVPLLQYNPNNLRHDALFVNKPLHQFQVSLCHRDSAWWRLKRNIHFSH